MLFNYCPLTDCTNILWLSVRKQIGCKLHNLSTMEISWDRDGRKVANTCRGRKIQRQHNPTEKARKRTAMDAFFGETDPNIWDAALSVRGRERDESQEGQSLAQTSQSGIKDRKATCRVGDEKLKQFTIVTSAWTWNIINVSRLPIL